MKKTLTVTLCMLLSGLLSYAQYDTTYSSTYYRQKLSQFRLLADTGKGAYIFLGDSITDIGEWAEIFGKKNIKNRGISADNTFGVLNRLDEVTARKPAAVFIMIGINDIAANVPDSVIAANYKKIIERIHRESPSTRVYVQSLLPTNNDFTDFTRHQNKEAHIQAVNKALKLLSERTNCIYVNLYPLMTDKEGKLDKRYTNDGLHLTGAGYLVWKNELTGKGYLK